MQQKTKEKYEILDRAQSGYYLDNPEPDFVNQRKVDKSNKILNYIRSEQPTSAENIQWMKVTQEDADIGLEGDGDGGPSQIMRNMDEKLDEKNKLLQITAGIRL